MSVRVVARVRPLLKNEIERDQIISIHDGLDTKASVVKIPNPKNFSEEYSFQFNSVYGQQSTQQEIFEAEVAPTIKHLFQGFDVTIFAYGSTGTGKTHTMRGGKSLADRGMIPRLLSSIYRKSKAIEKANEEATVQVSMSYYEIYNDRVFDLFEAPEKRTATGLPIREAEGGKTVVVGLTEMPCGSLKEFESLYDRANANRSVGATKLNAHSSRSHAILCVKVTIETPAETRVSTASAIDLAGSEDNRRTGNGKERMVESASINKSLFVLAQCVEAISKKQHRIPYRESKMTRILSLGQNNGFTVMILNLCPVRSNHLDTLSSLNFANRTKKIEVREIENEPLFKGPPRPQISSGAQSQRQPLKPLMNHININLGASRDVKSDKPAKQFSVYSDRSRPPIQVRPVVQKSSPLKRSADSSFLGATRPPKQARVDGLSLLRRGHSAQPGMTSEAIETLVEKKVSEILAAKAMNATVPPPTKDISDEVQARLDSIEKRLEGQDGERAEGLSYLFMAKQHQARGEDFSALKMYELAQPFFPDNEKLEKKIERLRSKIAEKKRAEQELPMQSVHIAPTQEHGKGQRNPSRADEDDSYHGNDEHVEYDDDAYSEDDRAKSKKSKSKTARNRQRAGSPDALPTSFCGPPTPRMGRVLDILNSRSVTRMRTLAGMGTKKAETIAEFLSQQDFELSSWNEVLNLDVKGIGKKTWEGMREGLAV